MVTKHRIDPLLKASIMCWIVVAFLVALLLNMNGCAKYKAWVGAVNQVDLQCPDSLIMKVVPAPKLTSGIIVMALDQIKDPRYLELAMVINQKALKLADEADITYDKFAEEILAACLDAKKVWGSDIIHILQPVQDAFVGNLAVMDECDRDLIKYFSMMRIRDLQDQMSFLSGHHHLLAWVRWRSSRILQESGCQVPAL